MDASKGNEPPNASSHEADVDQKAGPSHSQSLNEEINGLRSVVKEQQGIMNKLQENLQTMQLEIAALRAEISRISSVEDELKELKASFADLEARREKDLAIIPTVDQAPAEDSSKATDKGCVA